MRYYRLTEDGQSRLVVRTEDGMYNLTGVKADLDTFGDLARAAYVTDRTIDGVAERLLEVASTIDSITLAVETGIPFSPDEIWSETSSQVNPYEKALTVNDDLTVGSDETFALERPTLVFKSTDNRTVGPQSGIGVRADATGFTPLATLGCVVYHGEVVGYTVGNDMRSYVPNGEDHQVTTVSTIYDRCCAIGPCVASRDAIHSTEDLSVSLTISRNGSRLCERTTTIPDPASTAEDLVTSYAEHNAVPEKAVLLFKTSLGPSELLEPVEATTISIDAEHIGTLENTVVMV